jgi:hypothetical protein
MTPQLIRTLLAIAKETNAWPTLHHLRNAALKELEAAHLSTIEHIVPVMIVRDDAALSAEVLEGQDGRDRP